MPTDYTKLNPRELRRRSKSTDAEDMLHAITEIERRKRELPDASHQVWWARRAVIVTGIVGALTVLTGVIGVAFKVGFEPQTQVQQVAQREPPVPQAKNGDDALVGRSAGPPSAPNPQVLNPSSDSSATYKGKEPEPPKSTAGEKEHIPNSSKPPPGESTNASSASVAPQQSSSEIPVTFEAIPIGKNGLSLSDANSIASTAQSTAADILNCLVTYPSPEGGPCLGAYGAKVTTIRDNLHNYGIELAVLNAEVAKLESQPSTAELRRSAEVLRALADALRGAIKSGTATTVQEFPEPPVVLDPIFVGKNNLSDFEAQSIASSAQRTASELLDCLVERTESGYVECFSAYGTSVASVRDNLHNHGVEFGPLNDVVHSLESQPSALAMRHAALVLRAVADKILDMRQKGSTPSAKAAPVKIAINLPDAIRLSKRKMQSIAKVAELTASAIETCTAEFGDASMCVDRTVFADWGYGSVVEQINNIRLELAKGDIVVDQMEDAAKRLQGGPSEDDLRSIARILDELSKQLDAKAR